MMGHVVGDEADAGLAGCNSAKMIRAISMCSGECPSSRISKLVMGEVELKLTKQGWVDVRNDLASSPELISFPIFFDDLIVSMDCRSACSQMALDELVEVPEFGMDAPADGVGLTSSSSSSP